MSTHTIPPWLPPALSWTAIQLLTGATVTLTRASSPLRILAAATTALLAYTLQVTIKAHYAGTPASGPLVAMTWVSVLNALDLLVFSRVEFAIQREYEDTQNSKKERDSAATTTATATQSRENGDTETEKEKDQGEGWRKLRFALEIPYNYRRINTPWQITRLPAFTYNPTKSTFLRRSLITLLLSVALMILIPLEPDNPYLAANLAKLDTSKSILSLPFTTTTNQEINTNTASLFLQARFTLSFGIVCRAAIISSYTSASILAVASGFSEPSSWPPAFAGIREASSLAGLWGQSWHQLFRRPFTSPATTLLSILGIPPRSRISHWTRVLVAFTGSGVIHALCDIGFGVSWEKSGGLTFFVLQIPGIVVESFAGYFADKIGMRRGGIIRNAVGYVWTAGYLLWSAPVWVNPILVSLAGDGTKVMSPWFGLEPEWFGGL
ncbi:membrane bound O-acyl transferase family-domain-containing protein [Aspergillus crustosus]